MPRLDGSSSEVRAPESATFRGVQLALTTFLLVTRGPGRGGVGALDRVFPRGGVEMRYSEQGHLD